LSRICPDHHFEDGSLFLADQQALIGPWLIPGVADEPPRQSAGRQIVPLRDYSADNRGAIAPGGLEQPLSACR